jgi:flavorubredoxin
MRDIVLVYITKSGNTGLVADAIADGARDMGLDAGVFSLCDARIDEILAADAIAFGSPTYEHRMLAPMEKFLDRLDSKKCQGKIGIAFGSYGWSGEAPLAIAKKMREIGFEVLDPVLRVQYEPLEKDVESCRLLGKGIAKKLKSIKRKTIA